MTKEHIAAIREALERFPDINDGRLTPEQHHEAALDYRWGDFEKVLENLTALEAMIETK